MANNPKKKADPTEAALSAIQEALNSRDQNNLTANHPEEMSDFFSGDPNEAEQTAGSDAADGSPTGSDDLADLAARAANDDQQSIGHVLQSLQRRPARASGSADRNSESRSGAISSPANRSHSAPSGTAMLR